jgi:hypothetical protein
VFAVAIVIRIEVFRRLVIVGVLALVFLVLVLVLFLVCRRRLLLVCRRRRRV